MYVIGYAAAGAAANINKTQPSCRGKTESVNHTKFSRRRMHQNGVFLKSSTK